MSAERMPISRGITPEPIEEIKWQKGRRRR